jgi:outer membrane protein assembly factor BamB
MPNGLAPLLLAASLLPAGSRLAHGTDWPHFQGPARNSTSAETGLRRAWPTPGPPVRWTAAIGPGYGGAAVRDGDVMLLDRERERRDVLRCFDLETGQERWRFAYDAPGRLNYGGSRTVPTITEDRVYTIGAFGHVHCLDRSTHAPVWQCSLEERFEGDMPVFGWAQSPVLHEGLVIVAPLGPAVGLVALDAATGREVWRSGPLGSSHSTPALVELGGTTHLVFLSRDGERGLLTSFEPTTGRVLWQHEGYVVKRAIPAVTRVSDDRLFVTGGYRAGSLMLEVAAREGGYRTRELFRHQRGSQIHLPILVDDHLFVLANENWNDRRRHEEGGMMCLDLEGNERWRTGADPYLGRGPMLLADGMLIVQDGYSGILRLVEPRADEFRVLASADLFGVTDDEDHGMWAPMALSDGRLLLRSQTELKCVDLRASSTAAEGP